MSNSPEIATAVTKYLWTPDVPIGYGIYEKHIKGYGEREQPIHFACRCSGIHHCGYSEKRISPVEHTYNPESFDPNPLIKNEIGVPPSSNHQFFGIWIPRNGAFEYTGPDIPVRFSSFPGFHNEEDITLIESTVLRPSHPWTKHLPFPLNDNGAYCARIEVDFPGELVGLCGISTEYQRSQLEPKLRDAFDRNYTLTS